MVLTVEAGPREVVVRRYTTTEIEIYWGDGSSLVSGFQGYVVNIGPSVTAIPRTEDTVARRATFTSLTPAQLYRITITVDGTTDVTYSGEQRTSEFCFSCWSGTSCQRGESRPGIGEG